MPRSFELRGAGELLVAVVDGPYDAGALSSVLAKDPVDFGNRGCDINANIACGHGTYVMGILGARRDALIPGLCPDCRLLHIPLLSDEESPSASVAELAGAIRAAAFAGARLINLSLAIRGDDTKTHPELAAALDAAEARGAIVLAAAGNEGRLALGELLSHPATVPVVAMDASNRILPDCNFGPVIWRRGVRAFGREVLGYAPGGGTVVMSGTSVATAIATGTLARLWSANPEMGERQIRAAIARLPRRDGSGPPILDPHILQHLLNQRRTVSAASSGPMKRIELRGDAMMSDQNENLSTSDRHAGPTARAVPVVAPAQGPVGPSCSGACACGNGDVRLQYFVYVLGSVDIRFPNQAVAEELQIVARKIAQGQQADARGRKEIEQKDDEDLRSWCSRVLIAPEARYVARQVCWILKVEGQPAYYLSLRDFYDLDKLVRCLGRPEDDLELFVGTSSLVPVETCPGISSPVLMVDQLERIEQRRFIEWFESPPEATRRRKGKQPQDEEPNPKEPTPIEFFHLLVQSADNFGDTDEWRALNYLAVNCRDLYEKCAEMVREGFLLDSIRVVRSRLWREEKRVVDPVFAFRHWKTGVIRRKFVRVDLTHLFPVIANTVADYFDR